MKSGRILQKQRSEFSGLGQGLNPATKLIDIFLGYRLPFLFGALSSDLHRVREFLPQFYRKIEVGGCLFDPSFGHCLGRWPIKSKVDFRSEERRVGKERRDGWSRYGQT